MTESHSKLIPATYTFEVNGRKLTLDFPHAFALGDVLLAGNHLAAAKSVFESLAKVADRGPRARIMLARCQAGLNNFTACSATLEAAFDGEKEPIAEDLHSALVFLKLGFRDDAIRALGKIAMRFKSLPTICLLLGDLFVKQGDNEKAIACWKMAFKRDRLRGGVALAAGRRLKSSNKAAGG